MRMTGMLGLLGGLCVVASCGDSASVSSSISSNTRTDLITPIHELVVGPGESKILASFSTEDMDDTTRIELLLKARYDTTRFSEGSFPLLRILVNGQPLTAEAVKNEPNCFKYPNCFWGPDCAEVCNPYFFGNVTFDIACGDISFTHEEVSGMFDIQVSPNFTNHMLPLDAEGTPHAFYIDPAVSGDPYALMLDLTSRALAQGQLTIVIENPISEYKDLSICQGTGATEGNLVLGDVRIRSIR